MKLPAISEPRAELQALLRTCQDVRQLLVNAGLAGAQEIPWDSAASKRRPGITGCVPSNSTGDAANDLNFTEGWIVDTDGFSWYQPAFSELRLDAAFSQGHKGGLLDAPQTAAGVGNSTYHIFAIYSEKTGKAAYVASRQTVPVLPGDYNRYWRAFSLYRLAGANVLFTANETGGGGLKVRRLVQIDDGSLSGGSVTLTTQQAVTLSVPTGIRVQPITYIAVFDSTAANNTWWLVSSLDETDSAPSASIFTFLTGVVTGPLQAYAGGLIDAITDTSARIGLRASATTADHGAEISTRGWIDHRTS